MKYLQRYGRAPTSGGQYHWVSEFAPSSVQKPFSYIAGWLSALGWQTIVAGSSYLGGSMILTLASMDNPSYVPAPWYVALKTAEVVETVQRSRLTCSGPKGR